MATSTIPQSANNFKVESGKAYCKMPDGTLMQWGSSYIPNGQYVEQVGLQTPFANTDYSVQVTFIANDNAVHNVASLIKKTNEIDVNRTSNSGVLYFDYFAIGRWK